MLLLGSKVLHAGLNKVGCAVWFPVLRYGCPSPSLLTPPPPPPPPQGWSEAPRLRLLNLKYDVMPAEYVTMIVTELGMVPPTSVPVILREFRDASELPQAHR